ncbi:hypothetical protein FRC20_009324 [Serendipita sp. 405]|nr:hypothetical protein FRC20_009324 [Serendipita sp. 405]
MHIFALGASRNIGYYAALRLLSKGDTVTFVLRSPATLEADEALKEYVSNGKARLVKGDALSADDIKAAWLGAVAVAPVDFIMFTVGSPTATFSFREGFVIHPRDLCTRSLLTLIKAIHSATPSHLIPRLVVLSSTGLTRQSKAVLPWLLRPLYGWLLHVPHDDKKGMEAVVHEGWGKPYEEGETPDESVLPAGWKEGLPSTGGGWAKQSVIIRSAFLLDGELKEQYRAQPGDFTTTWISRQDVGHFIAERLVNEWKTFGGNIVTVGN